LLRQPRLRPLLPYHRHYATLHLAPTSAFLFHRRGAPRPLHSFPTRRSSDLSASRTACSTASRSPATASTGSTSPSATGWTSRTGDRKSTRLNSSHVSSSYAVFCLKKKRHVNKARETRTSTPNILTIASDDVR